MNDCVGLCGCGKGLDGVRGSRGGDSHGCGEGASDWGIVSRDGTAMIWCDSTMIGSIVFFLVLLDGIPQQSLGRDDSGSTGYHETNDNVYEVQSSQNRAGSNKVC